MKIAWLINIVMPEVADRLGLWKTSLGGWLIGQLNGIKETNNELHIISVSKDITELQKIKIDNVHYYLIPDGKDTSLEKSLSNVLSEMEYDIFHIFGTESSASYVAAKISDSKRTVVSIQGLVSMCAKHVGDDIPEYYYRKTLLKRFGKKVLNVSIIEDDAIRLSKNGEREKQIIKGARHIIGRTTWDRACVYQINPDADYYVCREILRESFYTDKWSFDNCEKHTIFLSQSASPIKGLHRVMEALPLVIEHYPDTQVYIAGAPLSDFSRRGKLKGKMVEYFCGYQGYIEKLVRENGLYGRLHFLNYLDENEMRKQYLKANVFVLSSSIENSPNSLGEAMILGVPCIASCVGGIQDMLHAPSEGFMFPADEPYMLAYYICKIFESKETAKSISEKARNHALLTHNIKENTKDLLEIYKIIESEK